MLGVTSRSEYRNGMSRIIMSVKKFVQKMCLRIDEFSMIQLWAFWIIALALLIWILLR